MKRKKIKLSSSVKKYIRKEKARIRREYPHEEQEKMINDLYKKFIKINS